MKVSSKNLFIALIFVTGLVLLSACETGPVAKPGLYVNKENRFTVEYPANFYSRPPMYKNEVFFSIYSESELYPTMSIVIADKMKFEDAPGLLIKRLKAYFYSDIKIISKKNTKLTDGTPAYEVSASSSYHGNRANTIFLNVIKGEKIIGVQVTNQKELNEDLKKIPYSLKFYK